MRKNSSSAGVQKAVLPRFVLLLVGVSLAIVGAAWGIGATLATWSAKDTPTDGDRGMGCIHLTWDQQLKAFDPKALPGSVSAYRILDERTHSLRFDGADLRWNTDAFGWRADLKLETVVKEGASPNQKNGNAQALQFNCDSSIFEQKMPGLGTLRFVFELDGAQQLLVGTQGERLQKRTESRVETLWNEDRHVVHVSGGIYSARQLALTSDQRWLIAGHEDALLLWDIKTGHPLKALLDVPESSRSPFCLAAGERLLAVLVSDAEATLLQVLDLDSAHWMHPTWETDQLAGSSLARTHLACHPTLPLFATAHDNLGLGPIDADSKVAGLLAVHDMTGAFDLSGNASDSFD